MHFFKWHIPGLMVPSIICQLIVVSCGKPLNPQRSLVWNYNIICTPPPHSFIFTKEYITDFDHSNYNGYGTFFPKKLMISLRQLMELLVFNPSFQDHDESLVLLGFVSTSRQITRESRRFLTSSTVYCSDYVFTLNKHRNEWSVQ